MTMHRIVQIGSLRFWRTEDSWEWDEFWLSAYDDLDFEPWHIWPGFDRAEGELTLRIWGAACPLSDAPATNLRLALD